MIKKIQTLLAVICFITIGALQSAAQVDIDVSWGKLNLVEKRSAYMFVGEGADGSVFVLKTDKKRRKYIEKYDNGDMGHEFTEKIDFQLTRNSTSKKDRLDYEDIFVMDDGIVVFASNYNKKEDYFTLYARTYGFDGAENSGWIKLESIYASRRRKTGFYDIVLSKDKSKFLVKHTLPSKKTEPRKYGYSVFDAKLDKVYKKVVTFSKASKKDDIYVFSDKISNDGTVYFFARVNGELSFYSLDSEDDDEADSKDMLSYKVIFKQKHIIEMASFEDNKGYIVLTGFYNDLSVKRGYGISGVAYVKLKKEDLSEQIANTSAFTQEYLENFMSARSAKKGRGISTSYDMRHLIFNESGEATLIAENTYVVEHCSRDPKTGIQTCTYSYHHDQLMIIGITEKGDLKYTQYLKKFAASSNPYFGGMSYSVLPVGNNIVIFYNDHYKNYRPGSKRVRSMPTYRRAVLVKAVISPDGEIEKEVLARHKEIKLSVHPRYTMRMNNGKGLIMLGYYKRAMRMGRFEVAGAN